MVAPGWSTAGMSPLAIRAAAPLRARTSGTSSARAWTAPLSASFQRGRPGGGATGLRLASTMRMADRTAMTTPSMRWAAYSAVRTSAASVRAITRPMGNMARISRALSQ